MASVKITGIKNVKDSVKKTFESVRKDPALLNEIGQDLQKDIVSNARAGRSVDGTAFRRLSQSWLKTREYLRRFNSVGEFYLGSSKANLTFTGKFLESLKYKVNPNQGLVSVEPEGTHPGYSTGSGKTDSLSNKTLAKYLKDLGFEFLFVSEKFRKRTVVTVKRFLRRKILSNK